MSQRHITHMVRPGRTTLVTDETGNIQTVQVQHTAFETRKLNSMQQIGLASALPLGSDTMSINVGGDNSNGVIIASNHQTYRPKNLKPGEIMLYDCQATQQSIYLKSDGSVTIAGFHKVAITCDTEVDITAPTVKITGNLQVTGSVTAGFGGSDSVGLQTHQHGDTGDLATATIPPTAGT